jgi:hypothetical protein
MLFGLNTMVDDAFWQKMDRFLVAVAAAVGSKIC